MAKYIENLSKGVICFEKKNFIPGGPSVLVTDREANHKIIKAYIDAEKLVLSEIQDHQKIDEMSATQLKAYAAEKGIDVGSAKAKADILAAIKASEAGE